LTTDVGGENFVGHAQFPKSRQWRRRYAGNTMPKLCCTKRTTAGHRRELRLTGTDHRNKLFGGATLRAFPHIPPDSRAVATLGCRADQHDPLWAWVSGSADLAEVDPAANPARRINHGNS
jgi:hypothetical protein